MDVYCSTNMYSNYYSFHPAGLSCTLYLVIAPMNIRSSDWGSPYEIQLYLSVQMICRNIQFVYSLLNIDLLHHYVQAQQKINSSALYVVTTTLTRVPQVAIFAMTRRPDVSPTRDPLCCQTCLDTGSVLHQQ